MKAKPSRIPTSSRPAPPFIYISALPRTGSTVLSEALTRVPDSFIFHEPHLGKNYFAVKENDRQTLLACGIDLYRFTRWRLPIAFFQRRLRSIGFPQDYMVRAFKRRILPEIQPCIRQIGVKEIKNKGWENYLKHFPKMKTIILARDPRDIYLSYYRKWKRGTIAWKGPFNPQTVAGFLQDEFKLQKELMRHTDHLLIRYKDLCSDPDVFNKIKDFVDSPIFDQGEIGKFIRSHHGRVREYTIHGDRITTKSVDKWKREQNRELLAEALEFHDFLPDYTGFWGYS